MKKAIFALVVILALALAGCSGGGEKKEEEISTPTPAPTPTPAQTSIPEKTPTPAETHEGGGTTPSGEVIRTLYEMYVNKKMVHGTVTITENGKTHTSEFWFYFDADNRQKLLRMEGETEQGMGVVIIINKYDGNTLTTTMYSKGGMAMQQMGDCEWMKFTQTITVSPSEYEDVKDEPVSDSFEATLVQQGNIVQNYKIEYVDYDPSLFQPDGKVCDIGSFMSGGGG